MKYVQIENGIVVATASSGAFSAKPSGAVLADDDVECGYIYDEADGKFSKPPINYRDLFNAARDRLFAETTWVRERHTDRLELDGADPTWPAWLNYFQALRDMPDQPEFDASAPVWPETPE